jgi:hypothetical protein
VFKKILLATAAIAGLAHAAQAQLAPTVEGLCATIDSKPMTAGQKARAQIVCASPRLRANYQRFINQAVQLDPLINRAEGAELIARIKARTEEAGAYCHADQPNPQLPPSPAMENCVGYWQERVLADMDTLIQRAQARQGQAAVADFMQRLGNGFQQWQQTMPR